MAILPIETFFQKLIIDSFSLYLNDSIMHSREGSGNIIVSSPYPRLWQGSMQCISHPDHDIQRKFSAYFQNIQNAGTQFDVYDPRYVEPLNYKITDNVSGAKINVITNGYQFNMGGLPANFKLAAGDQFSILINGCNRLFLIADDVTANLSGNAVVKLVNPIPTTLPATTPITLLYPRVTVQYLPSSFAGGAGSKARTEGISISFIQSVKAYS